MTVYRQLNKLFTIIWRTEQCTFLLFSILIVHEKLKRCFLLESHYLWHESIEPEEQINVNHAIFSLFITLAAATCKIKVTHKRFPTKIKSIFRSSRTFVVLLWHSQTSRFLIRNQRVVTFCAPDTKHGISGWYYAWRSITLLYFGNKNFQVSPNLSQFNIQTKSDNLKLGILMMKRFLR